MIFYIHKLVGGIELRVFSEQGEVQQPYMDHRLHHLIPLSGVQVVKGPAEIAQRTLRPVMLVDDLQLEIDDSAVVQQYLDVQDEILVPDGRARFNGIDD